MSDSNFNKNQNNLPEWIRQLRSQSWQIEILIAGSTVYTLFYLSDHLRSLFYHVYPGIDFNLTRTLLLFGVYLVSRILLIGFTMNLVIRAVWLAYLGINFAFPKGIDFERLKNNEESKELLRKQPSILDRVTALEKYSKLSYSLAILLAIFMTSVFITTIAIHAILEQINFGTIIYEAWFSYSLAILIAIVQIGVIDRLFLTKKTKYPLVNSIKSKLSTFLEYATLSFLFRREFLAIKSNTNRWALALFTAFILMLSAIITSYQIGKYWNSGTFEVKIFNDRKFFDIDYDPLLELYSYDTNISKETSVISASIQSEIIKGRYLRLFVTSWWKFDNKLESSFKQHNYPLNYKSKSSSDFIQTKETADSIFNIVINELFEVDIDGDIQGDLSWKSTNHPKCLTKGYVTFIDISKLSTEEHRLNLFVDYSKENNKTSKTRWKQIPFWKE